MDLNKITYLLITRTLKKMSVLNLKEYLSIFFPLPVLLPCANEVWGKVMRLHLSVSHSVLVGGVHPHRQTHP